MISCHFLCSPITIVWSFWCHQQKVNWMSETWGQCVKTVFLIIIYGFVISCKRWINICTLMRNFLCAYSVLFRCLFPSLLSSSWNKHQYNSLVSTWTVWHLSMYIIPYILKMIIISIPLQWNQSNAVRMLLIIKHMEPETNRGPSQ